MSGVSSSHSLDQSIENALAFFNTPIIPQVPLPSLPSFSDTPPSRCSDIALKVALIAGIILGAALLVICSLMCTPGSIGFIAGIATGSAMLVLSVFAKVLLSSMSANARPLHPATPLRTSATSVLPLVAAPVRTTAAAPTPVVPVPVPVAISTTATPSVAVPVPEFPFAITVSALLPSRLVGEDYIRLHKEYDGLDQAMLDEPEELFHCEHAGLKENIYYDARYPDAFLPHKATMPKDPENEKFYYNADLVFNGKAIASQWPIPAMFNNFWRMMEFSKVKVIVQLQDFNIECTRYYPLPDQSASYGTVKVQNHGEKLVFQSGKEKIYLSHLSVNGEDLFHYRVEGWPDQGLISVNTLTALTQRLHVHYRKDEKIAIHCRVGVGRTGVVACGLENFSQRERGNKDPNLVKQTLIALRKDRSSSVQTPEQYKLIHRLDEQVLLSMAAPD